MKDSLEPHFKFLYDLLKDNYTDYSYYVFSTTSAILLIIGWLLTSTDARTYISEHARIKILMLVGIVFFFVAEIYLSCGAKEKSDKISNLLEKASQADALISEEYYSPKKVPPQGVFAFVTAHAVLYVVLIWIICSIPNRAGSPTEEA